MTVPLIHAEAARVAVDGIVRIETFTFSSVGNRWALAGDVEPLIYLLGAAAEAWSGLGRAHSGRVMLASGALSVLGADVASEQHLGLVGMAACDPPLARDMTVMESTEWAARLSSGNREVAKQQAKAALAAVGMEQAAQRNVGTLALPERRALVIAQAVASDPKVLVVETPLAGLEADAAGFVLAALRGASQSRALIASVLRVSSSAEAEILQLVEGVSLFAGGQMVLAGRGEDIFSHGRLLGLTVRSNADPLIRRLVARGVRVFGGPQRFSISLPPGVVPREVLACAAEEGAAVVELLPLV